MLIDAPLPGVGPWEDILKNPLLWHFRFGGPDMERLVAGRERIYLDRFWNEFSATPTRFSEAARRHYAKLYAAPGRDACGLRAVRGLRSGRDRQQGVPGPGQAGDAGPGARRRKILRTYDGSGHAFAATRVTEAVVPDSGHWIMEENPSATMALVRAFLRSGMQEQRLTPQAIEALKPVATSGTSGAPGLETRILSGDPSTPGPYTIVLTVPAHTRIAAHRHRDDRAAVVLSGEWRFGYGPSAVAAAMETLKPGSFYTEPAEQPHFAETGDTPATVVISGFGPSDTIYEAH